MSTPVYLLLRRDTYPNGTRDDDPIGIFDDRAKAWQQIVGYVQVHAKNRWSLTGFEIYLFHLNDAIYKRHIIFEFDEAVDFILRGVNPLP